MDRIGLVSVSWRHGDLDAVAGFTVVPEERAELLARLRREAGLSEAVYLATCNRVEVAFVGEEGTDLARYRPRIFQVLAGRPPEPGEAERKLRAWAGEGAVEHLFCVAAGLDSARMGENEVAGQVRLAHERSRELGLTDLRLDLIFEQALHVAARVHSRTGVSRGKESLAELAIARVREHLRRAPGSVAVVGVSEMTRRTARELAAEGVDLVVVNRTLSRAQELAGEVGAVARALDTFRHDPDPVEALVLATSSPDRVLDLGALRLLASRAPSRRPLVVDLAVPPDIDPEDARAAGLARVGMDAITREARLNRTRRLGEMAEARTLVDQALEEVRRTLTDRVLAPVLQVVQQSYRQTALDGVERLLRRELSGLDPDASAAVRRWAEALARKLAHLPSAGLREVAMHAGSPGVEAFLARADARLARKLRQALYRTVALRTEEVGE